MNEAGPELLPDPDLATDPAPIEDFRRRTARERRRKTSRRLIEAVFSIIDKGGLDRISVDEVRTTAALSRGAFYRYFGTLDSLLAHVTEAIGAQINAEMSAHFDGLEDPALRISLHLRYLIRRATSDASCGRLLSRTLPVTGSLSEFARQHATSTFAAAASQGRFNLHSLAVAIDLAYGMQAAMLRRSVIDGFETQRVSFETAMLLRACGMTDEEATRLSAEPLPEPPRVSLRSLVLAISLG